MDINDLIVSEELHIKLLDSLVKDAIHEEQLLTLKLMELEADKEATLAESLADKVAVFGGSWTFILSFGVFILIWICANVFWFTNQKLDPYPFIFLNLILSCLAALQAPVIMMSQNRKEEKDRRRARSDYMINLKAEMEIRGLHSKLDLLVAEEMKTLFQVQQSQMEMLVQINSKLNKQ